MDEEQKAILEKVKEQNKEQLAGFKTELKQLADDSKKGLISKEEYDRGIDKITKGLADINEDLAKNFTSKLETLETAMKDQGKKLKEMQDGGKSGDSGKGLRGEVQEILKSADFKEFVESNGKKKASFTIKTVGIVDDYTGTSRVHITSRDSRVVDHPKVIRLNVRDLLTVMPTDLPYLAFTEVYDWDRQSTTITENGALAESSFKVREATVDAKRIGTHVPISKRMLRSAAYIENHLMMRLPAQVKYQEDFQLLFGDGQGNNVNGVFNVADDFAAIVNSSITGAPGAVASVETYNEGTQALITLTNSQDRLNNGDTVTIANATASGYNAAHQVILISPTQFVIDAAYAAEADTSAWTFVVNNAFKDSIEAAQEIDVLKVARTLVTQQEYTANGFVLNPVDATKIETLKGSDEHYLDIQRMENGILMISGVPVVETTAMPAGKFIVADWAMAAALLMFTELTLEFSESTQEKLKNQIEAIIQEEIIFPIYNKYMIVRGDFSTAKNSISV